MSRDDNSVGQTQSNSPSSPFSRQVDNRARSFVTWSVDSHFTLRVIHRVEGHPTGSNSSGGDLTGTRLSDSASRVWILAFGRKSSWYSLKLCSGVSFYLNRSSNRMGSCIAVISSFERP